MSGTRVAAGALGAALALGASLGAPSARADEEARQWLADMTTAVATRNYQGEFLHLSGSHVEKLQILHRVKDGHVTERLVSLSGNGREVVRNDGEVQCYLPDQRKVLVETHAEHGPLLGPLPSGADQLEAHYRIEMAARVGSVIGRPARIVAVNPLDGYRFGYRVWIDEGTHMPIRTDLCDAEGNVLEQVLFTSLKVGGVLPDSAFRPGLATEGYTWVRQASGTVRASAGELPWSVLQMPPGFQIRSRGMERLPGNEIPVMHVVLTDGLASVSVFIEGPPSPPHRPTEGEGRIGSSFAYSKVVNGHQVTAVGEVPASTVQLIATGVAQLQSPRGGFSAPAGISPPP